jgi:malate synthase
VTATALAKVREDKLREAGDGFDGTWVAHPDLVPIAMEVFDEVLGARPHQKGRLREDVNVSPEALQRIEVPGGRVTEAGVRLNVSVALQYLDAWFGGNGAAAINNLMEDTATAEISRAQLWQWIRHGARLEDGTAVTADLYERIRTEALAELGGAGARHLGAAAEVLDELVLNAAFVEFLTLIAYPRLA